MFFVGGGGTGGAEMTLQLKTMANYDLFGFCSFLFYMKVSEGVGFRV